MRAIDADDSSLSLVNSILWGNAYQIRSYSGSISIQYSDIQGGFGDPNTTHNVDKDPLFIDANSGNFYLQSGSPCIDAGTNENAPSVDLDFLSRPQDGDGDGEAICDMGAYEFVGAEIHIFCGGSIQTAVNSANDNDLIIVNPGTYAESIDFLGKAVTIKSTDPNDPDSVAATIISGSTEGGVVIFDKSEGVDSVLDGFTIKNGVDKGILIENSSPMIANCRIIQNQL